MTYKAQVKNKCYMPGDLVWNAHTNLFGIILSSSTSANSPVLPPNWLVASVWYGQEISTLACPNVERGFKNVVRVSVDLQRQFSILWSDKRREWADQDAQ